MFAWGVHGAVHGDSIVLVSVAFECVDVYIVFMSKVKTEGRALVSKGKLTPDGVAFKHG